MPSREKGYIILSGSSSFPKGVMIPQHQSPWLSVQLSTSFFQKSNRGGWCGLFSYSYRVNGRVNGYNLPTSGEWNGTCGAVLPVSRAYIHGPRGVNTSAPLVQRLPKISTWSWSGQDHLAGAVQCIPWCACTR